MFMIHVDIFFLQVIALTEELLATAKQNEISGSNNEAGVNQSSSHSKEVRLVLSYDFLCILIVVSCFYDRRYLYWV